MIITKTPFRMSFFGGGTDIQEYFAEEGGAVLSTTFDKYCYVNVRHLPGFFDYSSEFVYNRIERVNSREEIRHPLIRNAVKMLDMENIRLSYEADLPARSGLGTSSSFAVGMLQAFHAMKEEYPDRRRLAEEAIHLERTLCGEAGGWQDQIAAAYGGFNKIEFCGNQFSVTPAVISPEKKQELNDRLLLFFTGFTRISSEVQKDNRPASKKAELRALKQLVTEAEQALSEGDLDGFGRLLDSSWQIKRGIGAKVSTEQIDGLYAKGMAAGALGGKLLGAGGGGFLLFYAPQERIDSVRTSMSGLPEIPFRFEETGTELMYSSEA